MDWDKFRSIYIKTAAVESGRNHLIVGIAPKTSCHGPKTSFSWKALYQDNKDWITLEATILNKRSEEVLFSTESTAMRCPTTFAWRAGYRYIKVTGSLQIDDYTSASFIYSTYF